MPKIEEDGKSWLRRPKLYKGVVEPYKKKKKKVLIQKEAIETLGRLTFSRLMTYIYVVPHR